MKVAFEAPGLPEDTPVDVIDEERRLVAGEDRFVDDFGELAVHIHRSRAP